MNVPWIGRGLAALVIAAVCYVVGGDFREVAGYVALLGVALLLIGLLDIRRA